MRPRLLSIFAAVLLAAVGAHAQDRLYSNEFPLGDVKLLDGPLKDARDLNLEVLMKYDVDRMLAPYRKESGLEMKAKPYPNWDGLDGHIAGHYLSAMAMNYAATGMEECRERMEYMLSELKEVHAAHAKNNPEWGKDYIGGFPGSDALWSSFKKGEFGIYFGAWAPFYNLHKMYAGLRDAWVYCGYEDAKEMFLAFADWAISLTSEFTEEQMQAMMRNEQGGMNEVLADAYAVSGDVKYLDAARRFSHHQILDPMSRGVDCLDNLHANTQVPKAQGFERIGELSGDQKYLDAGRFFWETVTGNRSLAFGGNSRREHFPAEVAYIDFVNDNDGPESCNTYNMLKLTETLFRVNPSSSYTDYYERALFNHILSTQHPEHGGYVYFTSVRPRHYRVYSAPGEAMWCCVGTGMENHGKYGQFIYTHADEALYVNLFVASELDWKDRGVVIRQETAFPYGETSRITVADGKGKFALKVRRPSWVAEGEFAVKVNGKNVPAEAGADGYVALDRKWKKGDVVEVEFPMHTSVVPLQNEEQYVAFMHGPIVLGMKTGTEDLLGIIADDGRWSQYAGGEYLPVDKAPMLIYDEVKPLEDYLVPVEGKPLHFKFEGVEILNPIEGELQPFYTIHDARYMMYWLSLSKAEYKDYLADLAAVEAEKLKLEGRSTDQVQPAEQQPETDHKMQSENSTTGNTNNYFFREAQNGGWFSYELATGGKTDLALYLKYWGVDDWGTRRFEIFIDDEKLTEVDNSRRWRSSQFKTEEYRIPASMVEGKEYVRVRFQSAPGTQVGGIYEVRLVVPETPKVAVLGDSYSTFQGHIPEGNASWYFTHPQGENDVIKVEDTWWHKFCAQNGYELTLNESWSGSTICNTGYNAQPCPTWSFIARMKNIVAGNPDLILILGGTNDSWANSPIGELKFSDWTEEDLNSYLPACCYMLDYLTKEVPDAEIVCVINSELKPEITRGQFDACAHYGAHALLLKDIEKKWNHPSVAGMTAICDQVSEFVKGL